MAKTEIQELAAAALAGASGAIAEPLLKVILAHLAAAGLPQRQVIDAAQALLADAMTVIDRGDLDNILTGPVREAKRLDVERLRSELYAELGLS